MIPVANTSHAAKIVDRTPSRNRGIETEQSGSISVPMLRGPSAASPGFLRSYSLSCQTGVIIRSGGTTHSSTMPRAMGAVAFEPDKGYRMGASPDFPSSTPLVDSNWGHPEHDSWLGRHQTRAKASQTVCLQHRLPPEAKACIHAR